MSSTWPSARSRFFCQSTNSGKAKCFYSSCWECHEALQGVRKDVALLLESSMLPRCYNHPKSTYLEKSRDSHNYDSQVQPLDA